MISLQIICEEIVQSAVTRTEEVIPHEGKETRLHHDPLPQGYSPPKLNLETLLVDPRISVSDCWLTL